MKLGALHAGFGWTHLCKFFACLNMPFMSFPTFKKYETIVGNAAEEIAKKSCKAAAESERQKTIEQAEVLEKSL